MINYNEELLTYAEVSEMIHNAKEEAKYSHLLEGFIICEITESMYYAKKGEC